MDRPSRLRALLAELKRRRVFVEHPEAAFVALG